MQSNSGFENLDEDGYTQLNFTTQGITRRPLVSKKGHENVQLKASTGRYLHSKERLPASGTLLCPAGPSLLKFIAFNFRLQWLPPSASAGTCATSCWCPIAVTLGLLFLVILVIAVVLGTMAIWRSNSESNPLENDNFTSRNKENHSQTTQSSSDDNVVPIMKATKAPTTTGVSPSSCPLNWISFENSCYLLRTSLHSWNRSKSHCSQVGSNLVKIDSSEELEFIVRLVSSQPDKSFWIGLSRPWTEGPWLWEDGSTFSSNLFEIRSTETQEYSSHNCVWIHASIIYDQLCSLLSYSICEKKLSK